MEKEILKIDAKKGVLDVKLNDLIAMIPSTENVMWSILSIEAIGNNTFVGSVLNLEKEIEYSQNGLILPTDKLKDLSKRFTQIIDLTLIGDRDQNNLIRYQSIEEACRKCDYVLELVDSSYWIISGATGFIDMIRNKPLLS